MSQAPTGLATPSTAEAAARRPSSSAVGRLGSADSIDTGGFAPGTVLSDRYRVIGLLGRGGMGEVYRADDLKLGQPVALKFLPESFANDAVARERFYSEVRLARQVSHPNVCRVYDVVDVEG
ncbi:MAG TPA: protein kinase, partial [Thermoanaerobaculia bacterium]